MERRDFLKGATIAAGAAAAGTLAAPAIAQGKRELRLVMSWPINFPGLGTSSVRMSKRITQLSEGKLTIKPYGAGELVPAFQVFDAVSAGDADIYHSADYYFQGKSQAFNFMTAVPFGMTGLEQYAWIYYGGGQELWDELSAGFNLKALPVASTGTQMGGWFRKEINNVDDLQGLKMRMPGLGGEVLRAVGATPVNLPGGEIFPALQSGAIDATEWVGPWHDLAFGFYKITKNYYYPGWHEPCAVGSLGFNKDLWESFTDDQRLMLEAVVSAEAQIQTAEYNARNQDALNTLIDKHGVKLHRFSDELLTRFSEASADVISQLANADEMTKRVYDSYSAYQKKAMAWAETSEQGFMNARALRS